MEFWLIMIAFIVMGGSCSLAGTWWDRKNKKGLPYSASLRYRYIEIYNIIHAYRVIRQENDDDDV